MGSSPYWYFVAGFLIGVVCGFMLAGGVGEMLGSPILRKWPEQMPMARLRLPPPAENIRPAENGSSTPPDHHMLSNHVLDLMRVANQVANQPTTEDKPMSPKSASPRTSWERLRRRGASDTCEEATPESSVVAATSLPRSSSDGEHLTSVEEALFDSGVCPDCGIPDTLREGPHGGGSVNISCDNRRCGSRFNEMGPFGVDRISNKSPLAGLVV